MTNQTKQHIQQAIRQFAQGSLRDSALHLLDTLGYRSQRELALDNSPDAFLTQFDPTGDKLRPDKALVADWQSVDLLRQITDDDIQQANQMVLLDSAGQVVDNAIIESYLFIAIDLQGVSYTRTQLAQITREVNKLFPMPAMLIFRHGETLTLSIINRRLHKKDRQKDVLEKVTLIKDIRIANPHRAHVEILFDLSLDELHRVHGFTNFVELHKAWQKTLDSAELNKKFFREIANWYFWAVESVTFPADAGPEETRNAVSVIRLITRLIFVWFLKEKGLVPDDLFNRRKLDKLLTWDDFNDSTYYKAILQNLFFATLNQEMNTPEKPDNRKFRGQRASGQAQHYLIHNVYRYENYFTDPQAALALFANIPFLNGGLFECLDRRGEDGQAVRVDGFSDRADNPLRVPDDLFWGEERTVDLNAVYGTRGKRYQVRGLIHTLNRYKFTIAENTPIEEEIALDPELLGKVFENLLAAYNPETGTTARKQTGSFYTPREIVNYMVDESLLAYLGTKLKEKARSNRFSGGTTEAVTTNEEGVRSNRFSGGTTEAVTINLDARLRHLLAYNEEPHQFNEAEVAALIAAIDHINILDPACGSGAFPMGILHKLVFILGKLDPHNAQWKERQIEPLRQAIKAAAAIPDSKIRAQTVQELEEQIEGVEQAFARNELDYGRKLYLIENCIYGVDIQPIAVQIAKLRFFISLVVDQRIDDSAPNRGILPLPNLETKFVAANTLLGIEKPQQAAQSFGDFAVAQLREKLTEIRHRLFVARTPATKNKLREQDKALRRQLAEALQQQSGWGAAATEKLAQWDPYDQNASADFFDPEWMFGLTDGFDVVIGNPPYGARIEQNDLKIIKKKLKHTNNSNSAALFIDYGMNRLTKSTGILTFIVPKSLLYSQRWFSLVKALLGKTSILVDVEKAFDNVKLEQVLFVLNRTLKTKHYTARKFIDGEFVNTVKIPNQIALSLEAWICDIKEQELLLAQKIINSPHTLMRDISKTKRGVGLQKYLSSDSKGVPVIGGKNIFQYGTAGLMGYLPQTEILKRKKKLQFLENKKILSQDIIAHIQNPKPHIKITSYYDETGNVYSLDTVQNTVIVDSNYSYEFILALLNSTFVSWYTYKFIYCSAIRTMHFDNYYIGKIPIPYDNATFFL